MVSVSAGTLPLPPLRWSARGVALCLHLCAFLLWGWPKAEEWVMPAQQVVEVSLLAATELSEKAEPSPVVDAPKPAQKVVARKAAPAPSTTPKQRAQQEATAESLAQVSPAAQPTQAAAASKKQSAYTQPVHDAAYLRNPAPAYPAAAKRRRLEGDLWLTVQVRADGSAERVEVTTSSGHDMLDAAAREAVLRWRFIPAQREGEAIAAEVRIPISFRLK